ncbi:MAG: hypothetical protein ACJ8KU_01565 [Chthoniobacterales bacterium]
MVLRIPRLKRAVERIHNCRAKHAGSRIIVERLPDGSIWRGTVEVFEISGHPEAHRCYAWIEERGTRSVSVTRLRIAPVTSAQHAVRSALARAIGARVPAH